MNLVMSQWSQEEQSPAIERRRDHQVVTAAWQQTANQTHLNHLHVVS